MITSAQNSFVKQIAGLKQRKNRDNAGLFIIEGEKFIKELPNDWEIREFVVDDGFAGDLSWYIQRAEVKYVSDTVFKRISDTITPQGVLAVVKQKEYGLDMLHKMDQPFILLCEGIQDPGNLGTLLRTADASGCDCVILSVGCVDVYNPKVLRAAAGSVFHVPVIERAVMANTVDRLTRWGVNVIAANPVGGRPAYETDLTESCAILIGSEGRGISEETMALVKTLVSIPMPGRAESLNASIAAAMLMYEAVRQRLLKQTLIR